MMKADYFWIIAVIFVIVLVFAWKPLMGVFSGVSDKVGNKDKYEAGKAVFYDTTRWGEGQYKSCAMCHAEDFVPEPGKEIKMTAYVPGQPVILKGIGKKYSSGVMDTGDGLYQQVNLCLSNGDRMAVGSFSRNAKFMEDLLFYVSKQ
jgi:hypothetical protein